MGPTSSGFTEDTHSGIFINNAKLPELLLVDQLIGLLNHWKTL